MFIRRDRKTIKDGKVRTYVSLAHNVWVEGPMGKKRAQPVIFARLGVEEELDIGMVRSARDAFDRYLKQRLAMEGLADEEAPPAAAENAAGAAVKRAAEAVAPVVPTLRVLASREYGMRVLVEPIWKRLGLASVVSQFAAEHKLGFDLERVVFGMVLNRLVDPMSKRACNEWLRDTAWFPEAADWKVHHFYRALDVLEAHEDDLAAGLRRSVWTQLSAEAQRLILLDTTSTYFESDYDDVERAAIAADWEAFLSGEGERPVSPFPQVVNEPPLRMRGKSKDHRPDKPQVVLGLACAGGGRLLRTRVYAGNTNDQTITQELVEDARAENPDAVPVVVMDSGMGGGPNLAELDAMEPPLHRISAVPLRNSKVGEEILAEPGRWRQHPDNEHFTYRVVELDAEKSPSGRAEMWIATRNAKGADRQIRQLERHLTRIRKVLEKDDRLDDHNREVCALLSHRTLKRYVRPSKNGKRLLLNRDRIQRERRRAGVKLLRTTLIDIDPIEIIRAYQALLHVENDIRTYKGPLKLRPMYHRSAHRIRAHVLICTMALMCLQAIEAETGLPFRRIRDVFTRVHANQIEQGTTRHWQRTEWSFEAEEILAGLGIAEGPVTWDAERVQEVTSD